MEFGTFSFTILGGYKKVFRPPKHTLTILGGGIKNFLDPQFWGGIKKFLDPPKNTHTNNFGGYKKF